MDILKKNKEQIPQYLHFRCGMNHLKYSLKNLAKTLKLQKNYYKLIWIMIKLIIINYKDKKDEWLDYVKQDVLCNAFPYSRYCKAMEEITGFSKKDCLSAPGLGWKYFNSMRDENDEPIYTYNDKYIRRFER